MARRRRPNLASPSDYRDSQISLRRFNAKAEDAAGELNAGCVWPLLHKPTTTSMLQGVRRSATDNHALAATRPLGELLTRRRNRNKFSPVPNHVLPVRQRLAKMPHHGTALPAIPVPPPCGATSRLRQDRPQRHCHLHSTIQGCIARRRSPLPPRPSAAECPLASAPKLFLALTSPLAIPHIRSQPILGDWPSFNP